MHRTQSTPSPYFFLFSMLLNLIIMMRFGGPPPLARSLTLLINKYLLTWFSLSGMS